MFMKPRQANLLSIAVLVLLAAAVSTVTARPAVSNDAPGSKVVNPPKVKTFYLHPSEFDKYTPMEMPDGGKFLGTLEEGNVPVHHVLDPKAPIDYQPPVEVHVPDNTVPSVNNLIQIRQTDQYPWSTVCKLYLEFHDGSTSTCSGSLILGERLVLTAGHCVFSSTVGWVRSITVVPGLDGQQQPFGQYQATIASALTGWVNGEDIYYDIAAIRLNEETGTGWLGHRFFSGPGELQGRGINVAGYPGVLKTGIDMWYEFENVTWVAWPFYHAYDGCSEQGMSGGPVWVREGSERQTIGVVSTGAIEPNGNPSCPDYRGNANLSRDRIKWLSCEALAAGQKIDLGISANQQVYRSFDTLKVDVTHAGQITRCMDLYALVEIAGQFYYLPNFDQNPTPFATDGFAPTRTLVNAQFGQIDGSLPLSFHAAAFQEGTFRFVSEPQVVSTTVNLQP